MANLFKGYIKSKGKRPLGAIKNGDWLPVPPTDSDYVGVLRDEYIQLDFDSEEDSKIVLDIVAKLKLKCDILKTTRGVHLYFLADRYITRQSSMYNAIGMHCDIGLGFKNRVIPLKVTTEVETKRIINGIESMDTVTKTVQREWLQTYDELDVVPAFFRPISTFDYKLAECNTRNQSLFTYILTLQTHNFSKEDTRKTIKIINEFIFREKLSDKEIDTITRDDAFSEEIFFGEKGKFLHDRFGDYMLSNCHIMSIKGQIYIYNRDHIYTTEKKDFERIMLDKIKFLKKTQQAEVLHYLERQCTTVGEFASPKYIGLKSSVLDITSKEEFPYSPKWVIQNKVQYDYNPNAYYQPLDEMLNKVSCNDKEIRMLLEEMIGYTLYRENSMQVCFILTGGGSNGKSKFMDMIKYFLGEDNYSALEMKDLEEKFEKINLLGKLANIGDDIDNKFLQSDSTFKKTVSGETIMVQYKGQDSFKLNSYATHIFSANELPMVKDKTDGFSRRIILVPFNAKFSVTDKDYDPFISDKIQTKESMEYLLKLAIDGLQRVLSTRTFTKSSLGEQEKNEYIRSNNNVLEWFESEPNIKNEGVNDLYMVYQVWCAGNGCMPVKKLNFSKEIKRHYGLISKVKSINGKAIRVYAEEEEENEKE